MSGVATGAGTRPDVTLKLPQLQNLCKRDPDGYRDDYQAQVRRLEGEVALLNIQAEASPRLIELIQFCAAVASSSYKGAESDRIVALLKTLLVGTDETSVPALSLHKDLRKSCVSALILMRNKGVVEPLDLLQLFFRLLSVVPDKALRQQLYQHMVSDIRNLNKKKRDEKVNRQIQVFLHKIVTQSDDATATKRATDLVCELYRRKVWTDERAVAIVATAVQSPHITVSCRAIRFFLGIEESMAKDEAAQKEEDWAAKNTIDYHSHSKKTKAHKRQVERAVKNRKKAQQKRENEDWMEVTVEKDEGVEHAKKLYPAIELLRDPQGLAEYVMKKLKSSGSIKYETKLLMINFVTRLVGNHELLLLPLYPFLQKYMGGAQRDVTQILAYAVQACHEQVPPDEIYAILKTIAHNFITERCSEEQMAVGINAARAICARVPATLALEETQDTGTAMDMEAFVRDLAAFATHRDRSVSIAGKAWTNFVREVHPGLLQGKTRGMKGSALHRAGVKPMRYGQHKAAAGVEGADLLVEYESKKAAYLSRRKAGDDDDEEDDASGEWNDVEETEGDEVEIDDDEEEEEIEDEGEDVEEAAESDDEEAPNLVDLATLSASERDALKQQVSSTRIFTASDFRKMRQLVEREERNRSDPRAAARRKRAIAKGQEFEELSGDSDSEDEEGLRIKGVVDPTMLMAESKKKRQSKAEKLEKIIAGRTAFESKQREGGSTNIEKKRKKNFLMSKNAVKGKGKGGLQGSKKSLQIMKGSHRAKKRRRKL